MAAERIQPALSSIGQGLGGAQVLNPTDPRRPNVPNQAVADFKKRTAEQNKPVEVDLEKLKKMQEAREGIYNINNEYKDALIEDEYYKRTVEGGEDYNKVIDDITTELQRVNKTETELIKPFIKEATTVGENGERVMIYDDEGKFIPPDEALTFLTSSLQDSPEAQEAKEKRVYNTWLQQKIADLRKRSLKYDPSFSLGNEMLTEFKKFATLPGVSDQTDVAAAFEELNQGANLSTVFESRPDLRNEFMDYLGSRTDIVPKWASNYAVTTGMSPYTLKSGEGEFMGLAMDAMMEEAENVFLPAPQQTQRMSVSQKREGSGAPDISGMFSSPAKDTAPIGRNRDELETRSVTVQTEEPFPIKVGTQREYAESRKVHYDQNNDKFYMEYVPYKDVETGNVIKLDGLSIEDLSGSKYKPDYTDVRFVQISEDDPNFESFVSTVAKTTKAERGDIASRIFSLKDVQQDRQQGEKKEAQGGYKVGQEVDGYRYTGGDPTDSKNWEEIK